MSADLSTSLQVSAAGLDAQSARLRVIAENLANQASTGSSPGAEAYRRRTISFENRLDRALGVDTVRVRDVGRDRSEQAKHYDPAHPAADKDGYVKVPNVNAIVELLDMHDAEQAYSANLTAAQAARAMMTRTLDLLK